MSIRTTVSTLALATALAACGAKEASPEANTPPAAAEAKPAAPTKAAVPDKAPAAAPAKKSAVKENTGATAMIDHTVTTLDGKTVALSDYRGKALLVVNTASQCGYTPQYESLQKLQKQYEGKPFTVLAFPSNDFGAQEPGDADEIAKFVNETYGITFPMFSKMKVKGADKTALYKTLTEQTGDGIRGEVKWNFTKFLVGSDGQVLARFEPGVDPLDSEVTSAIDTALP